MEGTAKSGGGREAAGGVEEGREAGAVTGMITCAVRLEGRRELVEQKSCRGLSGLNKDVVCVDTWSGIK